MLATLCSLVKKGLLSVSDAAKELGVSEEAFKKMAML
jgi:predicted ArsR family transcriptional regulator